MWAAEPPPGPPAWQTWLPTLIGLIITAVGGIIGTVWVKQLNRRVDDATAVKTHSESRKAEAEAEATQVTTARGLVAEIRAMMVDQREGYEGQIQSLRGQSEAQIETVKVQHQADMKTMADRLAGIEATFSRHREWDDRATTILRQSDPNFPDPPAVHFD